MDYPAYSVFLEDPKRRVDEELQRQRRQSGRALIRIEENTKVVKDDIAEIRDDLKMVKF